MIKEYENSSFLERALLRLEESIDIIQNKSKDKLVNLEKIIVEESQDRIVSFSELILENDYKEFLKGLTKIIRHSRLPIELKFILHRDYLFFLSSPVLESLIINTVVYKIDSSYMCIDEQFRIDNYIKFNRYISHLSNQFSSTTDFIDLNSIYTSGSIEKEFNLSNKANALTFKIRDAYVSIKFQNTNNISSDSGNETGFSSVHDVVNQLSESESSTVENNNYEYETLQKKSFVIKTVLNREMEIKNHILNRLFSSVEFTFLKIKLLFFYLREVFKFLKFLDFIQYRV